MNGNGWQEWDIQYLESEIDRLKRDNLRLQSEVDNCPLPEVINQVRELKERIIELERGEKPKATPAVGKATVADMSIMAGIVEMINGSQGQFSYTYVQTKDD